MENDIEKRLEDSIAFLEEAKLTHVQWAEFLEAGGESTHPDIGDAKFHRGLIDKYDSAIQTVRELKRGIDGAQREPVYISNLKLWLNDAQVERDRLRGVVDEMRTENAALKQQVEGMRIQNIKECARVLMDVALDMIEADPHQWSSRPCQTCRRISALVDRPFGCVKRATYEHALEAKKAGGK